MFPHPAHVENLTVRNWTSSLNLGSRYLPSIPIAVPTSDFRVRFRFRLTTVTHRLVTGLLPNTLSVIDLQPRVFRLSINSSHSTADAYRPSYTKSMLDLHHSAIFWYQENPIVLASSSQHFGTPPALADCCLINKCSRRPHIGPVDIMGNPGRLHVSHPILLVRLSPLTIHEFTSASALFTRHKPPDIPETLCLSFLGTSLCYSS